MSETVKIFHIDDEAEMHLLVKMILTKYGYEIENAFDGKDALEKLANYRPDLILLDIAMPILDGWALREQILKLDHLKGVPIVLLTAKYGSGDAMQGLHEMEVNAYLTKPFTPSELLNVVKEVLPEG